LAVPVIRDLLISIPIWGDQLQGVTLVFIPVVWKLIVPPRVHFFLSNNKLLIRDNLDKRMRVDDLSFMFCGEESINHLFFECVVAKQASKLISEADGFHTGTNFESVMKCWLCNKKFGVVNMITSAF
jgi:hypothetical protein